MIIMSLVPDDQLGHIFSCASNSLSPIDILSHSALVQLGFKIQVNSISPSFTSYYALASLLFHPAAFVFLSPHIQQPRSRPISSLLWLVDYGWGKKVKLLLISFYMRHQHLLLCIKTPFRHNPVRCTRRETLPMRKKTQQDISLFLINRWKIFPVVKNLEKWWQGN